MVVVGAVATSANASRDSRAPRTVPLSRRRALLGFLRLLRGRLKQRLGDLRRDGLRRMLFLVRHPPLRWLSVAEAVASAASSASCDQCAEHVGIVSVIMPEAELGQVERQVLRGDLVVAPDDPALQEGP